MKQQPRLLYWTSKCTGVTSCSRRAIVWLFIMASNTGEGFEVFCFSFYLLIAPLGANTSFFTGFQLKGSFTKEKKPFWIGTRSVSYVTRAALCSIRCRHHGGGFCSLSTTATGLWRPLAPPREWPLLYFPSAHSRCAFVMPQITNGLKRLSPPTPCPQPIKKDVCLKEGWQDGQSCRGDENINSDSQWTIITTTIIILTSSSTEAAAAAEMCSYSIDLRESIAPWGALNRQCRHPNLPSSDGVSLENNCGTEDHTVTVLNMSEWQQSSLRWWSVFWKGRWAHANVITAYFRITSGYDPRKTESLWRQMWNCNRKLGWGRFLSPAAVSCAGSVISAAEHETCISLPLFLFLS